VSWFALPVALYTNLPEKFIKKKIDDDGSRRFVSKHIDTSTALPRPETAA
jgi:hypothetical protein